MFRAFVLYHRHTPAFTQRGLAGLLPQQRGPKRPHNLTPEVMAFIDTQLRGERPPGTRALARAMRAELGLSIHPRSIERALARKKT